MRWVECTTVALVWSSPLRRHTLSTRFVIAPFPVPAKLMERKVGNTARLCEYTIAKTRIYAGLHSLTLHPYSTI
jgi:hypothetical protein